MLLKFVLPCKHPFMAEITVRLLVVSIGIIYFFFELLQSLLLRVLLPVEISRIVREIRALGWHQVVYEEIKSHLITSVVVHGRTWVNSIKDILFVIFSELLLEPPNLFKL